MSRELDALLARIDDPALRADLERQIDLVRAKRSFGLVFESHLPERVRLPSHPVRRGSTVVFRDDSDDRAWTVELVRAMRATIVREDEAARTVAMVELVVVAEFGEPIYPGLRSVGSVRRGGHKPSHVVINGENHHALEALQFTHVGKVDCIYIDPPYNSGARDWKYDNDYVDGEDTYRHSKWLAFMERRLLLAKELLNPDDSVLIVTIDEKEYLRLGMLLDQTFPTERIQMISSLINPAGGARAGAFGRSDEYLYFVFVGSAAPQRVRLGREWVSGRGRTHTGNVRWDLLRRSGTKDARREDRPGCFYPIYIDPTGPRIASVGEPLSPGQSTPDELAGAVALLPIRKDGSEGRWQWNPATLRARQEQGRVRVSGSTEKGFVISTLKDGEYKKIMRGEFQVEGKSADGSLIVKNSTTDSVLAVPHSQWRVPAHDATQYGTRLLAELLPGRSFPFPKSLYAVEDAIRFFLTDKPNAVILDFFAGSGTAAHAVARLNRQDEGQRQSILVTNNEVSVAEASALRSDGYEPGMPEWERLGIFEHITRPRITAAVTGLTPYGDSIRGDYKFNDEFPISEGLEENVEFFELTYQDGERVELDLAFEAIAPLLWLRAGAVGPVVSDTRNSAGQRLSYEFGQNYAVLFNSDRWRELLDRMTDEICTIFIVTDSTTTFASVAAELPAGVEAVRLYRNYLSTFEINSGSGV